MCVTFIQMPHGTGVVNIYNVVIFFFGGGGYSVIYTISASSPKSRLSSTSADVSGLAFRPVRGGVRREVNLTSPVWRWTPNEMLLKGILYYDSNNSDGRRQKAEIMPHVLTFKGENNATERWE